MIYGYARVSTCGQTLGAQLDQLRKARCTKIYREKVTGARAGFYAQERAAIDGGERFPELQRRCAACRVPGYYIAYAAFRNSISGMAMRASGFSARQERVSFTTPARNGSGSLCQ
jgi:Resolvase, N terminal domain